MPVFLSTPSARRATVKVDVKTARLSNFYPRPPRGGRQEEIAKRIGQLKISIHALREEGDRIQYSVSLHMSNFYPRPPRGGRRG